MVAGIPTAQRVVVQKDKGEYKLIVDGTNLLVSWLYWHRALSFALGLRLLTLRCAILALGCAALRLIKLAHMLHKRCCSLG